MASQVKPNIRFNQLYVESDDYINNPSTYITGSFLYDRMGDLN